MAKNLALAGVNSIVVNDNNIITESDYHNNFLVQFSRNEAHNKKERRRGSVAAAALRSLNPFVQINCDLIEEEHLSMYPERNSANDKLGISVNSKDGILVCVVQVKNIQEMQTAMSRFALAEILLLSYTIDKTTVATFVLYAHKNNCEEEEVKILQDVANSTDNGNNNNNDHGSNAHIFGKQLHSLLYDVDKTQRLPRQMQRALLQLHLNEMVHTVKLDSNYYFNGDTQKTIKTKITTSSIMACAMNTVEMLKLYTLTTEDIAASVTYAMQLCTCADNSSSKCDFLVEHQTDAITATMCGAALAQFLILQIGSFETKNDDDKKNSNNDDCTVNKVNRSEKHDSQ